MVVLSEVGFLDLTSQHEIKLEQRKKRMMDSLAKICDNTGYHIIQTNGQRVYAPRSDVDCPEPPKGCEVFIGKLHKNIYEDYLIPLFETIGRLYKFRLMLDFSENTRGYAFATYYTREHADLAIDRLNGFEIKKNLKIGVYKSVDNCRLFIGNLPIDKTNLEVHQILSNYVDGIKDIIMYSDYENPRFNRGFVFVEFENHRMAAMARRQFSPENLTIEGKTLFVDWADPVPEVDPKIMEKVTILYMKGIPIDFTSNELHAIICNYVGVKYLKKTHKMNNYAFVHFVNRESAEHGFNILKDRAVAGMVISGHRIAVEWARPRKFSKKNRMSSEPTNFCTSVPPNLRRMVHKKISDLHSSSSSSGSSARKSSIVSLSSIGSFPQSSRSIQL